MMRRSPNVIGCTGDVVLVRCYDLIMEIRYINKIFRGPEMLWIAALTGADKQKPSTGSV